MKNSHLPTHSDRINWLNHKGFEVLEVNYGGLQAKNPSDFQIFADTVDEAAVLYQNISTPTRVMTIVLGGSATSAAMKKLSHLQETANENNVSVKSCVVGLLGIQKTLLNMLNLLTRSNVNSFPNREEALEFLISS